MRTRALALLMMMAGLILMGGCSSIRTSDTPRTATEEFLVTQAAVRAIEQLSVENIRDFGPVYIETRFLFPEVSRERQAAPDRLFVIAELRAKLLNAGVRVVDTREESNLVVEVRAGALAADRENLLVGLPQVAMPGLSSETNAAVVFPEIALLKNIKQSGFASIAIIAIDRKTGELRASSGPFVGRTNREDWWILGYGPRTSGNIAPAQQQ